jgi:hypothetical protein
LQNVILPLRRTGTNTILAFTAIAARLLRNQVLTGIFRTVWPCGIAQIQAYSAGSSLAMTQEFSGSKQHQPGTAVAEPTSRGIAGFPGGKSIEAQNGFYLPLCCMTRMTITALKEIP